ncbi:MAG: flagellar hook-basal body complex protein FliE [Betaproteobacteria bacterium]|nr:MAG: flagellar hook-basal body complex protein FliE [Betaproteobacteria bacterium]
MNVYAIDPTPLSSAQDARSLPANAPAQTFSAADDAVRRLAVGEPVNLHQVMVQLERAKLQFELVLQVRNKLLEAYQDLLRMQI